jgi:nitrate/TMAO reductase-like tetraheme cytochrome c subunit
VKKVGEIREMDNNEPSLENHKVAKENDGEISQLSNLSGVGGNLTSSSGTPPGPPRRKWRWLKRLAFLLCLLAIGAIGLTQAMGSSGASTVLCQVCHEMKPEIVTWQASDHSKAACIQCHTDINVTHFFQIIHFTNKYDLPIQVLKPVPDSTCETCHSNNRTITPNGDIKVPHDKHTKAGVACVTCHIGVAHGGIAEREATIDTDLGSWTAVMGRQNMAEQYKTLSMTECLDCHKTNKGPQNCEACHARIVTPASHKTADWVAKGVHGQQAENDIDSCNKCHSNTLSLVRVPNDDKAIAYARSNSFCVACHTKKPASHNLKPFSHDVQAAQDKSKCLVCHDENTATKADGATKTVCMTCHNQQHTVPEFHPVPIQGVTGPVPSCYKCHVENTCIQCHK